MLHRHQIRVRYGETDKMGVVHHSVYSLYFEEARTELLRAVGFRYSELERDGFLLPLTALEIRFHRGPVYDDLLSVEARLISVTKVRMSIRYRIFREADGELLAVGATHHAVTGPELRPRRLPPEIYQPLAGAVAPDLAGEPPARGSEVPGPASRQKPKGMEPRSR